MLDFINQIAEKVSFAHLNILLLLGLALFGGTVGGRLFQKLRIPQVIGYIVIGMLIGQSGLKIVDSNIVQALRPFNYFALGLIGFMVGGELRKEIFSKYGKHFIYILISEGMTPFLLVSLSIGIAGSFLFESKAFAWSLALLLGAIASATDPATTTAVFREYKTRGPVTTTSTGIVALDDGLALFLFAIASSVANTLVGQHNGGILSAIAHPLYEIGGAIVLGILAGLILSRMLTRYAEGERVLAFSIGMVLLVTGISMAANLSMLLALMTLGVVVVNIRPHKSKEAFSLVEGFTPPIYVLFFVLVGAQLKLKTMTFPIIALALIYLVGVIVGKILGADIGAYLSRAPKTVLKYLRYTLFSQAGIAIGLSILIAQYFPGNIGNTVIVIIAATTFITQIIGPFCTKYAVVKAGEVGLNITDEDVIQKSSARDFMDKNPPIIYENMQLADILKIFSEGDNLFYPVINKEKKLCGIITVEGIKHTLMETDIGGLILAHDLMERVIAKTSVAASATEVRGILNKHDIDYLPVVSGTNEVEGFIERRKLNKFISTKIMELQRRVESLG